MDHRESIAKPTTSRVTPTLQIAFILTVLFWIETFVVGFLESSGGYSHVKHAISLLMLADPPLGMIHQISFILLGAAAFGFAYAIYLVDDRATLAKGGLVAVLLVHGIGRVAEGVFVWRPDALASTSNMLHQSMGMLGVIAMLPAPFLAARVVRETGDSPTTRRISLGFGFVFLVLFALGMTVLPLGLGQRLGFLLWYAWLIYFALSVSKGESDSA